MPRPSRPPRLPSPENARPPAASAGRARAHDISIEGQTYTAADFGQNFIDNYGWLEVFGTRGHFVNDAIAGGFLILGPGIDYPDHHHVAEEIYIPLTGGTEWRMGDGAIARARLARSSTMPSNVNHAMRTGDEPLLALYLWRGGPLAQRSIIRRGQGRR